MNKKTTLMNEVLIMSTQLQAYFESEDAALAVKDQLIKYNITNLEISLLEDDGPEDNIPIAVPILTGGVTQVNTGMLGGVPLIAETGQGAFHDDQYTIYRAVLTGQVNPEAYEEVIELVQSNNGHIEEM
jgi:hypothetical protein